MKLETYRKLHGLTYKQLSDAIGAGGAATAQRYCSGKQVPDKKFMAEIHNFTDGQVSANDFHGQEPVFEPAEDTTAAE